MFVKKTLTKLEWTDYTWMMIDNYKKSSKQSKNLDFICRIIDTYRHCIFDNEIWKLSSFFIQSKFMYFLFSSLGSLRKLKSVKWYHFATKFYTSSFPHSFLLVCMCYSFRSWWRGKLMKMEEYIESLNQFLSNVLLWRHQYT